MTCLHNSFEPLNELSDLSDAYYRKLLNWILHKCLQYVIIVCLFLWVWYLVSPAFQVGRLPETGNKLRHDLQIIFQAVTVPRFHCSKVWVSLLSFWGSFEDNESSAFLEVFVNQFFYGRGIYVTDQTFRKVGPRFFLERLDQTETRTPCVRKNRWLRGHWNKKTTPIIFIAWANFTLMSRNAG